MRKQERKASKMPPPLTSFPLFPKLPTEIRLMVWNFSLEGRTVEIKWTESRGFFSRVPTPIALRVCQDSRDAVKSKYPLSFGNVIYKPSTVFNYALDTLYIDQDVQHQALHFLASLSAEEISQIKHLAIDSFLNEDWEIGGEMEWNLVEAYRKLASSMPALREYRIVHNLAFASHEEFQEGNGPMELYEDWPNGIWKQHCCDPDGLYWDDDDFECDDHLLPVAVNAIRGLKVPKMGSIWGWRPVKK